MKEATNWNWRDGALCAEVDPELMFPEPYDRRGTALARRVCMACEVRVDCLDDALQAGEVHHGVRGGLLPDERQKLRRGIPLDGGTAA